MKIDDIVNGTDAYRTLLLPDYPGSNTFGVLDAPGESRAWLVWGRSMFDPKCLVISFR